MNMSDELQKLYNLKEQGVLTEEEFAAAKKRVIDGEPEKASASGADSQRAQDKPRASSGLNDFRLSNRERWLGGVFGGLAEQTGIAAWYWSLAYELGFYVVMYALLWIFVPRQAFPAQPVAAASAPPPPQN